MFPDEQWRPLSLSTLREILSDAPFPWCLAGGYAVEMFVGREFRFHSDVDIVIFREDQHAVQRHLNGWHLYASDPPGTHRVWNDSEYLVEGIHDIWAYRNGQDHWECQFMIQEATGGTWFYRRDERVSGDVNNFIETYRDWPCIRIEIQLLYKSKALRAKDEEDFKQCLPLLDSSRRAWLASKLRQLYSDSHPWLSRLNE